MKTVIVNKEEEFSTKSVDKLETEVGPGVLADASQRGLGLTMMYYNSMTDHLTEVGQKPKAMELKSATKRDKRSVVIMHIFSLFAPASFTITG